MDATGKQACVITDWDNHVDIAHLDDNLRHSYLHNLVPVHKSLNRHLGALKQKYGSPTKFAVPCEDPRLEWTFLRCRSAMQRALWNVRHAYACVRFAYYTHTHYFRSDAPLLFEIITECLYFARHVWDDDLIWALLDHDLLPLLCAEHALLRRHEVAPLVRELASIWTEIRRPIVTDNILRECDALLTPSSADTKTLSSLLRRKGMSAVARLGYAGLLEAAAFGKEAYALASTTEQKINALEVEPWVAADRGDWRRVRRLLEDGVVETVLPIVDRFTRRLRQKRREGLLDSTLLFVPIDLTPLNAAQIPMDYAVSILKTDGITPASVRKAKTLIYNALPLYRLMGTRPFMLTDNVKKTYAEATAAIGDATIGAVVNGRVLSSRTINALKAVTAIAIRCLRQART